MGEDVQMRRAIELAERGRGQASPNPLVGALVVAVDGSVVGEGHHAGPGTPHAEVEALRAAGERAAGGTLVVTLEPCNHFGRTPPCTEAIIAAGIARVIVGMSDPNPEVDGGGIGRLRAAGITVEEGEGRDAVRRLNAPFVKHVTTGMPFVTWKWAASLDGKVAARDGSSRWISDEPSRADAHRLRSWSDAIVVGVGTVLADDPSLTVRLPGVADDRVTRIVVDGRGRTPADARVFVGGAPTIVATTSATPSATREAWRSVGAEVVAFDAEDGRVPLSALMAELGKRELQGVLLEGGPTLAWSMVADGLVDRVVAYLAPKLVGGRSAPGVLDGEGFAPIADALALAIVDVRTMGTDIRVEADVHGHR